jgi:post-segregation antitoxin (ccd killing protein)
MPRVSVWLPDDLADAVRRSSINLSQVTKAAVEDALGVTATCPHTVVECAKCRSRLKRPDDLEAAG